MLASWYLLLGFGDLGGPAPAGAREVIELVAPIETAVAFSSAIATTVELWSRINLQGPPS